MPFIDISFKKKNRVVNVTTLRLFCLRHQGGIKSMQQGGIGA